MQGGGKNLGSTVFFFVSTVFSFLSRRILYNTTSERSELKFLKKSMGARHRGGIGFSYRPARLHRLAEFIPLNQFRGTINI